jgi:hypothetical protein
MSGQTIAEHVYEIEQTAERVLPKPKKTPSKKNLSKKKS